MAFWDFVRKPAISGPKVLVLDIGSGSVKATLAVLDEAKRLGYIIGFGKHYYNGKFNYQNLPAPEITAELIRGAIDDACLAAKTKSSECILVFNGDILKGKLVGWQEMYEDHQERITQDGFQHLLEKIIKKAKEELNND